MMKSLNHLKRLHKSSVLAIMITQSEQEEEYNITSLSVLGYNNGNKGQLNTSLKSLFVSLQKKNQSQESLLSPDAIGENVDFEVESKRLFYEVIKSEFPPKFIYIQPIFKLLLFFYIYLIYKFNFFYIIIL